MKGLRVPTGGRAGSPTQTVAELFSVPLLGAVCDEHLLTSNKAALDLEFPFAALSLRLSVTGWTLTATGEQAAPTGAQGRSGALCCGASTRRWELVRMGAGAESWWEKAWGKLQRAGAAPGRVTVGPGPRQGSHRSHGNTGPGEF